MATENTPVPEARSVLELKHHVNNVIEALLALSPSRNYLSQFLSFLPDDYAAMYDSFPEFLADRAFRETLKSLLGLSYSSAIDVLSPSLGEKLLKVIAMVLEILGDENNLEELADFLKEVRDNNPVPNPLQEWGMMKLKAAVEDPAWGNPAREVLNVLAGRSQPASFHSTGSAQELSMPESGSQLCLSPAEITKRVSCPPEELLKVLNWLADHLKVLQRVTANVPGIALESTSEKYTLSDSILPEWLDEL
ncbi:MAG TPA: hypothetical protein VKK79_10495 [Candidatus Lokiarchaeia archaeon]|nr:hypothetical protein [Candidatus Lokiarchaeia archaeon]